MGNTSSTRWDGQPVRQCVEASFTLAPPRGKRLWPGRWEAVWPRSGVRVRCRLLRDGSGGFTILLDHNWAGGAVQTLKLDRTRPRGFGGGGRWWFLCPRCGKRAARLHLPYRGKVVREFKCRRCHDLTYESAQSSRSRMRAFFLLYARKMNLSYHEARERWRGEIGGHVHRVAVLKFGPPERAIEV